MKKEILEELYLIKKLSRADTAKELNCSIKNVMHFLRKYNIKRNDINILNDLGKKECPKCKIEKLKEDFYMRSAKGRKGCGSWCKECMKQQTLDRQRQYKESFVNQLGGMCKICNFDKYYGALEFHHIDSELKEVNISRLSRSPKNKMIQDELAKCVILCSNCHKMVHAGIITLL